MRIPLIAAKSTQNALISTIFNNGQMVAKMKAFDLLEGVMVTVLVDPDVYTPDDLWGSIRSIMLNI